LSLARELKFRSPECINIYIGHKGDNIDTLKQPSHDFDFMVFINAGKFRRYYNRGLSAKVFDVKTLLLNIRDFFRLPVSVVHSIRILKKFRPDVVFSKGGFVAVPVGIAAKLLGIPIVTHDSDTLPGLANKIIGRWAKINATGMPGELYSYPKSRVRYVGIPIDERIKKVTPKIQKQVRAGLKLPANSRVLLVSGGGNGSRRLNDLVLAIAAELLQTNLQLHIIHLSGPVHEETIKAAYKTLPKPIQKRVMVFGFSPEFYAYSAAADLIITRAGATTLAELAAAGKACIVIPAPFLAGGHQLKNAELLSEKDAAVVLSEQVSPEELLAVVNNLLNNDQRRFELARNLYSQATPDASKKLSQAIFEVAHEA
jgi:UDP-N-acetylglucosamine--N-acetylmuramyl-(pentapeptide) pyrophosphoryl-undecaprenol N-acetylglucosamine transferase